MRLEDGSGLELVKEIQKASPETKSLLLTGYGNIATAVAAIKSGAIDYLPKPAEIDQIYDALTSSKEILPKPKTATFFIELLLFLLLINFIISQHPLFFNIFISFFIEVMAFF